VKTVECDTGAIMESRNKGEAMPPSILEVHSLVTKYGDNLDDARKLARWIHDNLGPDTPLHFTRFHPDWQLTDVPPTPIKTLEKAHAAAKEEGLRYVYLGNVAGHQLENTYCPECNALLVGRWGFHIEEWCITKNKKCPDCGAEIAFRDH